MCVCVPRGSHAAWQIDGDLQMQASDSWTRTISLVALKGSDKFSKRSIACIGAF